MKKKPLSFYLEQSYPVTLFKEEEGGYTVWIQDLPGCISQGETLEEAMEMIEDARKCWTEVAYEGGYKIALPSETAWPKNWASK